MTTENPDHSTSEDIVTLWCKQSELFWRTVYAVPGIGILIFAGWYTVLKDAQYIIASLILYFEIFVMILQIFVIWRMSVYLNSFREAAGIRIPSVRAGKLSVPGWVLGNLVPLVLLLAFVALSWVPTEKIYITEKSPETSANTRSNPAPKAISIRPH